MSEKHNSDSSGDEGVCVQSFGAGKVLETGFVDLANSVYREKGKSVIKKRNKKAESTPNSTAKTNNNTDLKAMTTEKTNGVSGIELKTTNGSGDNTRIKANESTSKRCNTNVTPNSNKDKINEANVTVPTGSSPHAVKMDANVDKPAQFTKVSQSTNKAGPQNSSYDVTRVDSNGNTGKNQHGHKSSSSDTGLFTVERGVAYQNDGPYNDSVYIDGNGKIANLKFGSYSWIGLLPHTTFNEDLVTAITLYDSVSSIWYFPLTIGQVQNSLLCKLFEMTMATQSFSIESSEFYLSETHGNKNFESFCRNVKELTYRGRITPSLFYSFFNKNCTQLNLIIELPFSGNLKYADKSIQNLKQSSTDLQWREIVDIFSQCQNLRRLRIDVRANKTMTYRDVVMPMSKKRLGLNFVHIDVSCAVKMHEIGETHKMILSLLDAGSTALVTIDSKPTAFFHELVQKLGDEDTPEGEFQHWIGGSCLLTENFCGFTIETNSRTVHYTYRDNKSATAKSSKTIPEIMRIREN